MYGGGTGMASITIVGCGPGRKEYATGAALHAIAKADILVGAQRLLAEFGQGQIQIPFETVQDTINTVKEYSGKNVAVLVTGDPGFYSLTACIINKLGFQQVDIIPGISSVTYAFCRLGIPWYDAYFVSAHKNLPDNFNNLVCKYKKLGILTSPHHTAAVLVKIIEPDMIPCCRFFVGEQLTYPEEILQEYSVNELLTKITDPLSVLLIIRKQEQ